MFTIGSEFDFTSYIQLVDFLGACFGENTEVALYDFKDINHSIIAIYNGHITGRSVGAPLTNFVLSKLKDKGKEGPPYYLNYKGMTKSNIPVKVNSFFILDRSGNPRGMLTVSTDVTKYQQAAELLQKLAFFPVIDEPETDNNRINSSNNGNNSIDAFHSSPKEMIKGIVSEVTNYGDIAIDRLTVEEKMNVVKRLNAEKFFLIKGAVSEAADILGISAATVYRYLSKINKDVKVDKYYE